MLFDLGFKSPPPHATCLNPHPSHLQKCIWSVMCQFTGFCDAGCWAQRWSSVYIYKDLINQVLCDCVFWSSGIRCVMCQVASSVAWLWKWVPSKFFGVGMFGFFSACFTLLRHARWMDQRHRSHLWVSSVKKLNCNCKIRSQTLKLPNSRRLLMPLQDREPTYFWLPQVSVHDMESSEFTEWNMDLWQEKSHSVPSPNELMTSMLNANTHGNQRYWKKKWGH